MFKKLVLLIAPVVFALSIHSAHAYYDDSAESDKTRTLQSLHDMEPIFKADVMKMPMSSAEDTKALSTLAEMAKEDLNDLKWIEAVNRIDPLDLSLISEVPVTYSSTIEDDITTQMLLDRVEFSPSKAENAPKDKLSMGNKIANFLAKYYTPNSLYSPFYTLD